MEDIRHKKSFIIKFTNSINQCGQIVYMFVYEDEIITEHDFQLLNDTDSKDWTDSNDEYEDFLFR